MYANLGAIHDLSRINEDPPAINITFFKTGHWLHGMGHDRGTSVQSGTLASCWRLRRGWPSQKALTPNERDLAVSMETVLHSAVRLDRLDESLDTLAVPDRPKRNWSRINPKIEIVIAARQAHDLFAARAR